MKRRAARTHTRILAPGRPSDKNNDPHAPKQLRLGRTHRTHDKHETNKKKTRRCRSDGYGSGQAVPTPMNLHFFAFESTVWLGKLLKNRRLTDSPGSTAQALFVHTLCSESLLGRAAQPLGTEDHCLSVSRPLSDRNQCSSTGLEQASFCFESTFVFLAKSLSK